MFSEVENKVANLVKEGVVSAVFPARHSVRVTFEDRDNLVSSELPVVTLFANKNKSYALPDIGERVVVLSTSNDNLSGGGYVIGSIYTGEISAGVNDHDVAQVKFANGALGNYNRRDADFKIKFSDAASIEYKGGEGFTSGVNSLGDVGIGEIGSFGGVSSSIPAPDEHFFKFQFNDGAYFEYRENGGNHTFTFHFNDGSFIKHEGADGKLTIDNKGDIMINGDRRLFVNISDRIQITGGEAIWVTASDDIVERGSNIRLN